MKRLLLVGAAITYASVAISYAARSEGPLTVQASAKPQDTAKGQAQVKGGDGVFKSVYTLKDGLNFEVIGAKYSVEPFNSYESEIAGPDEKFLILTVAVKNSNPEDAFFNGDNEGLTAVDEKGQNHEGHNYRLVSLGIKGFSPTIKPGQGYGQDPAADELTVAIKMPSNARICKLILNQGRKAVSDEQVVRYFIAGAAKKDRDGADGNPKNVIGPLPEFLRDPADASGATALSEGKAKLDTFVPTGYCIMKCESVTTSTSEKLNDTAPDEGKQYAIVTMTAKSIYGKEVSLFDLVDGDGVPVLRDTDGEKHTPVSDSGVRKAKRDEQADTGMKIAPGESYTYRYYFLLPKDAKPKTLVFGQPSGHRYTVDLSPAK